MNERANQSGFSTLSVNERTREMRRVAAVVRTSRSIHRVFRNMTPLCRIPERTHYGDTNS